MAKNKKPRIAQDDVPEGLTHNPFAALRATSAERPSSPPPGLPLGSPLGLPTRSAPAVPSNSAPGSALVVRREKKGRGGKTVTRVSGLAHSGAALDDLARDMKRALGCGATVEDSDVLLQGSLTERAAQWLRKQLGARVTIGN